MRNNISNSADIIDSRDVIERIRELETERGILQDVVDEWNENYADELHSLKTLAEEVQQYSSEWPDGACLIRDTYFEDYVQKEAEDMGVITRNVNWPCNCIDWEEAARQWQQDYSCFGYGGEDYWVRST